MGKFKEFKENTLRDIYETSIRVYNGEIERNKAAKEIHSKYDTIPVTTYYIYYLILKHLLDGVGDTRDTAYELKKYYFERIKNDFGLDKLKTALNSFKETIQYYQNHGRNQKDNLEIYNFFSKQLLNIPKVELDDNFKKDICSGKLHLEGDIEQIVIKRHRRSNEARKECIYKYGTTCSVCKKNLEDIYGEMAKGFIHVHHIIPISTVKEAIEISCDDLRPVCPNCHAMLHIRNYTIEQLQEIMNEQKTLLTSNKNQRKHK